MDKKWGDFECYVLLTSAPKDWATIFPNNTYESLRVRRRNLKRDIASGAKKMPEKPADYNPEATPEELHEMLQKRIGELITPDSLDTSGLPEGVDISYHYGYIKNAEGEIEYTKPLPSVRLSKSKKVDDLFPQVESANIKPTTRKRARRLGKYIMGYGDGQVDFRIIRDPRTLETDVVPLQNVEMHRIILQMNAHYQPETTVNGGDFGDFAASSRFPADSDHFNSSMTMAMQWIHDFYAQMKADNPNARHVEVSSNHAERPKNKVLREAPEFYNFYRPGEDYPAWTYYSMAKLGELGIEYISGYPNGEYVHGDPKYPQILWKHGSLVGNNAVYREADKNPTINVIRFHNHGERMIKRTTREGQQLFYLILGSACINNRPVSGYNSSVNDLNQPVAYHNQDHVNSFVMVRDYGKGRFEPVTIDVVDGKAYYDGIEWDGTKPYEWEYRYGYVKKDGEEKKQ